MGKNSDSQKDEWYVFAVALAERVLPEEATSLEIGVLLIRIDEIASPAAAAARRIARPLPAPPVTVIAKFLLGEVPHDVVLAQQDNEEMLSGEEAIRRADQAPGGRVVRSEDDWEHTVRHQRELPPELDGYSIVTDRPHNGSAHYRSELHRLGLTNPEGFSIQGKWHRGVLILRRCTG